MKTIILCGGLGSRISEYTKIIPKPMIMIGSKPILLHIIDTYVKYGYEDFYLALGYKKKVVYDFFFNGKFKKSSSLNSFKNIISSFHCNNFKVNLVDTGTNSMTGGRLLRMKSLIGNHDFFLTYGDGLSNVNLKKLLKFHNKQNTIGTVTSVVPPARFGAMNISNNIVQKFSEKVHTKDTWINGGYFVFKKEIFDFLTNDSTVLEKNPLANLSKKKQLSAYKHKGFWQCMDTVRDRELLVQSNKLNPKPWLK